MGQYRAGKDRSGRQITGYGNPTDKDNNLFFMLEFSGNSIGHAQCKDGEVRSDDPQPAHAAAPREVRRPGRSGSAEYAGTRSACSIRRLSA